MRDSRHLIRGTGAKHLLPAKVRGRLAVALALLACGPALRAQTDSTGLEFFENKVRPILVEHCYSCHSAKAEKIKGDLRLDSKEDMLRGGTSGAVVVAGDPEQSLLIKSVRYTDKDLQMPPGKDGNKKLPNIVIADLTKWVKLGAPYPESASAGTRLDPQVKKPHWAFQPIHNPALPAVKKTSWPSASIDHFILAKIEERGLQPTSPADKRTLIRRATFDLIGLPPTPDEIDAFLADDSPNAFAKVVDRLLSSSHYGERWGRHWLDIVRYADTAGETADYPVPVAWRYRNYVIDSFNADKPYHEFLREQIVGDILASRGPRERYAERVTATGFLAISRRFGFDSENYHHLTIQDTIDTLGQTMLGLSLGCARCHDHKYDPILMTDYYALYGIFDSTRYAFPGSEQKQKYRAMVPLLPPDESQGKWREFDARVAALARKLEKQKQSVPAAVLRSLHDIDGDFEMQAAAAGGSKGVIVPPWIYEGKIAVTKEAQSPFQNFYGPGKVGASVPASTTGYRIAQALYPSRMHETCRVLHVNLDFRVATNDTSARGMHRFWIGARASPPDLLPTDQAPGNTERHSSTIGVVPETDSLGESPAVEIFLASDAVSLQAGDHIETLCTLKPAHWHNLQLALDLNTRTVSGSVGTADDVVTFASKPLSTTWSRTIDFVAFDSRSRINGALPGIELDNLGVQESPIAPVLTAPASLARTPDQPDAAALADLQTEAEKTKQELNTLLAEGPFALTYGVVEGTPHNARMQMRGEPDKPGAEVPRGFIKALGGDVLPAYASGSGRLELAQWITCQENPLTARVMVNRIWQYHFGRGLVKTPNDFGVRGQMPTHPELLDHLATKFIQSGWSIKAMHRLIMQSAVYQQASTGAALRRLSSESEIRNPKSTIEVNHLLTPAPTVDTSDLFASFPRRRLSAEEIRDAILFVSGELDPNPGRGHPFPTPTGWGYTQHSPFSAVYDHNKRSVYLMTQRIKRHPFLALFDGADPNASTAERRATTVPTQALFFLNDPFVHQKSERLAVRLQASRAGDAQRIELASRLALGRSPTEIERTEATEFFADYRSELVDAKQENVETTALAAYIRALFGSNEFLHID